MRAVVPAGRWPDPPSWPGDTLLEMWAHRWTSRPEQIVLADGWRTEPALRGAELDRRTALMAAALIDHGVGPGDRVLWQARATLASISALLAGLRAGAVVVPMSPSARAAEVDHVVRDATPVLVLADRADASSAVSETGVATLLIDQMVAAADGGGAPPIPPEVSSRTGPATTAPSSCTRRAPRVARRGPSTPTPHSGPA